MDPTIQSKGEKTRNEIITAAHALFAEQGYHGTSMRQISERAGVALGGIYNHFPGKEEIFKHIIIQFHPISEMLPKLEKIRGRESSEMIQYSAHTIQETLQERGDYINLLFAEIIEFKGHHLNTVFAEVFPRAVTTARELLNEKELRSKNISLMFMIFMATMFAFFIINRFINKQFIGRFIQLDLNEAVELLLHGFLKGSSGGES